MNVRTVATAIGTYFIAVGAIQLWSDNAQSSIADSLSVTLPSFNGWKLNAVVGSVILGSLYFDLVLYS